MRSLHLLVCIWLVATAQLFGKANATLPEYNVFDFGARADTNYLSTAAFQSAIDSAFASGGGVIQVPSGSFKIGTIVLKSNVTLNLQEGSVVFASPNINDYRAPFEHAKHPVLIYANGAQNIAITGSGLIDGRAKHVYEPLREIDSYIVNETELAKQSGVEMSRYYIVPPDVNLITLFDCEKIQIENVSIQNSSFWTLHLLECTDVKITGVTINSSLEKGVNADGIDLNLCRNVEIKQCTVRTGDDAIVIKSRADQLTENIQVSDCVVASSSSALKIGTESRGTIRQVVFQNCKVEDSNRGLSIVVLDGGTVSDVVFSNIDVECSRRHFNWWGDGDPIHVRLSKRRSKSKMGKISNIVFQNIDAVGVGTSLITSDTAGRIDNFQIKNVSLKMRPEKVPDMRATDALAISGVRNLTLYEVKVSWQTDTSQPTWRHSLNLDHVSGVEIINSTSENFHEQNDYSHLNIEASQDVRIERFKSNISKVSSLSLLGSDKEVNHYQLDASSAYQLLDFNLSELK